MAKLPWAIAHRPSSVDDFLFKDDTTKRLIGKFIEEQNIPTLLLSGHAGTGKSSLVNVLKHELKIDDMDFLYINASLKNSINNIRTDVLSFVNTMAMSTFKIVYLDEADRLSDEAQDSLKSMIEDYAENVRFILTCNRPHKIMFELRSRCQEITFKSLDKEEMILRGIHILMDEGIEVTKSTRKIMVKYRDAAYPDFRKFINLMQQNSIDGQLLDSEVEDETSEVHLGMLEYMESGKWSHVREFLCENTRVDEWDDVYRFLYNYIGALQIFADHPDKIEDSIVVIADHLYKHAIVADPEINFAACLIKLERIAKRK